MKKQKKKRNNLVRVVRKGSGAISRAEIDGGKMPLWSREFVLLRHRLPQDAPKPSKCYIYFTGCHNDVGQPINL